MHQRCFHVSRLGKTPKMMRQTRTKEQKPREVSHSFCLVEALPLFLNVGFSFNSVVLVSIALISSAIF
jgi:hypothetical protein